MVCQINDTGVQMSSRVLTKKKESTRIQKTVHSTTDAIPTSRYQHIILAGQAGLVPIGSTLGVVIASWRRSTTAPVKPSSVTE